MHLKNPSANRRSHLDEPTYWFAVLEIAREQSDYAKAADAKRQLKRLGVRVSYERLVDHGGRSHAS